MLGDQSGSIGHPAGGSDLLVLLNGTGAQPVHVAAVLREGSHWVEEVETLSQVLLRFQGQQSGLVLLNAAPEEVVDYCERFRKETMLKVPLLVLLPSGFAGTKQVYAAGAVDVIHQPSVDEELLARVSVHLRLARTERETPSRAQSCALQAALEEQRSTKDVLLRAVAHDIRSSLTSVVATLLFLQEDLGDRLPQENAEDIRQARIAANRLTELSRQVLDIARLDGEVATCSNATIPLGRLFDALRERCADVGLEAAEFSVDQPQAGLSCDEELLLRVLLALVHDADRHAPPETVVRVRSQVTDSSVKIGVEDEGRGLSEEDAGQLFEAYGPLKLRLRGVGRSTGIRLEFCRLAVRALGGTIGVSSNGRHGTCIWIEFPSKD